MLRSWVWKLGEKEAWFRIPSIFISLLQDLPFIDSCAVSLCFVSRVWLQKCLVIRNSLNKRSHSGLQDSEFQLPRIIIIFGTIASYTLSALHYHPHSHQSWPRVPRCSLYHRGSPYGTIALRPHPCPLSRGSSSSQLVLQLSDTQLMIYPTATISTRRQEDLYLIEKNWI